MLERLVVDDIALIEHAELRLGPGLSVLSGETGAGKTALLSALKLLIGERADATMIREGARSGEVSGTFGTSSGAFTARRRFGTDGRSRCWIDGSQATVAQLASRVGPLVDLHGQHEHQTLLSPASHLRFLDGWIGQEAADAREGYLEAFSARRQAQTDLDDIVEAARSSAADLEAQAFAMREISAISPSVEEYEQLQAQMPTLLNVEALAEGAEEAYCALADEGRAGDLVASASAALSRNGGTSPKGDEIAGRLEACGIELSDIALDLRAWRDSLDFDPQTVQESMQRLSDLDGLVRKYGPRMEDVLERLARAKRLTELTDTSTERIEAARARLETCEAELSERAEELRSVRESHADEFSDQLTGAVSSLGMEHASLFAVCTDLPRGAWGEDGPQQVELYYAPASAVSPRPLGKIASGGELSRVMLALKGTLVAHGGDTTLVFDEIDTGIGGATGTLVARRLKELSKSHQTIVVTHLPTIAAYADHQFTVSKTDDALPRTRIEPVEGATRVAEIARMLSGTIDEASLSHASALLAEGV